MHFNTAYPLAGEGVCVSQVKTAGLSIGSALLPSCTLSTRSKVHIRRHERRRVGEARARLPFRISDGQQVVVERRVWRTDGVGEGLRFARREVVACRRAGHKRRADRAQHPIRAEWISSAVVGIDDRAPAEINQRTDAPVRIVLHLIGPPSVSTITASRPAPS